MIDVFGRKILWDLLGEKVHISFIKILKFRRAFYEIYGFVLDFFVFFEVILGICVFIEFFIEFFVVRDNCRLQLCEKLQSFAEIRLLKDPDRNIVVFAEALSELS